MSAPSPSNPNLTVAAGEQPIEHSRPKDEPNFSGEKRRNARVAGDHAPTTMPGPRAQGKPGAVRSWLAIPTWFEWLLLPVGLGLTWRYFWFMDDAFVYFRYVDNLLWLGRGLVFNPGEYVEGFSSPLWALLLIPLRLTTLDYYTLLSAVAFFCCALVWWVSVYMSHRLSPEGSRVSLSTAILMTHYGVLSYFSSGLETPLVLLAAAGCALLCLTPSSRWLQLLLGLTPLVRPELSVPLIILMGLIFLTRRRFPWWLLGSCIGFGSLWLAFRVYYYADFFPNTYYLKDQADWSQGIHYLLYSLESHHLLKLLALLLSIGLGSWWLSRRNQVAEGAPPVRSLLLLCAASALIYPTRIGGDMVYFRFLAFPVCLGLLSASGLLETFFARARERLGKLNSHGNKYTWLLPSLGLGVGALCVSCYPSGLSQHPITLQAKVKHHERISEAAWHRQLKELGPSPDRRAEDRQRLKQYREANPAQRSGSTISLGGWCVKDYHAWDSSIVHEWGLTEPILARTNIPTDRPGHKLGLKPLARQLWRLRLAAPENQAGRYRSAAAQGRAPDWIEGNLEALELIEQKIYNSRRFWPNLRLAAQRPTVLIPPPKPKTP